MHVAMTCFSVCNTRRPRAGCGQWQALLRRRRWCCTDWWGVRWRRTSPSTRYWGGIETAINSSWSQQQVSNNIVTYRSWLLTVLPTF